MQGDISLLNSDGCPPGDYQDVQKYTVAGSAIPFCAADRVDAQLGENGALNTFTFEPKGGTGGVFTYDAFGLPAEVGSLAQPYAIRYAYAIAPGDTYVTVPSATSTATRSTNVTVNLPFPCPTTAQVPWISGCVAMVDPANRVTLLEANNQNIFQAVLDPAGNSYELGFDAAGNLTTVTRPISKSQNTTATTKFAYDEGNANAYLTHDLTGVTDPNGNQAVVSWNTSGMVTKTTDFSQQNDTIYSYLDTSCTPAVDTQSSTPGCTMNEANTQKTTVTFADGETDVDNYDQGTLTSYSFGAAGTNTALGQDETWTFNYHYPPVTKQNGPTTETVVLPGAANSVKTEVVTTDSVGNVLSVTDPAGNTTTNMYNDTGGNNMDELCWTAEPGIPVSSSASCSNPPSSGVTRYYYDSLGNRTITIDPLGNPTDASYATTTYTNNDGTENPVGMLCWTAKPSVVAALSLSEFLNPDGSCSSPPTGSTVTTYDAWGDVLNSKVEPVQVS